MQNDNLSEFIFDELKERAEIKRKSKRFKTAIDAEKKKCLKIMEEDSVIKNEEIEKDIAKLEGALQVGDSELIKEMLKNINI